MIEGPCCSHSIVAHHTVTGALPGTVIDAWACCDCGARFSRDLTLPTFQPEPSFLHDRNEALRAEVERLRAALHEICNTHQTGEDDCEELAHAIAYAALYPPPDNRDADPTPRAALDELAQMDQDLGLAGPTGESRNE